MVQKVDTGNLANIALELMTGIRMTLEHNAPLSGLFSKFNLKKGHDTGIFPKVGQMSVLALQEGEDLVDEQDIGLTTQSVTTGEVGAKVIVTQRLLNRIASGATGNLWTVIGEQLGDGGARKLDEDIAALFSGLNGGTDLGSAGTEFTAANAMSLISIAKTDKMGNDLRIVHHPNAMLRLLRDLSTIGSGQIRPMPAGFSKEILDKFWTGIMLGGVSFWEDGNITRDASDDAIGVIADKKALGVLWAQQQHKSREWDQSRRAWEMVFIMEYTAFELDDTLGGPVTLDAVNPTLA